MTMRLNCEPPTFPFSEARRPGTAAGLASYAWDDKLRNYVDLATGRMVKRQLITDLLRTVVSGSEGRLGLLGELYARGQITSRQFYELMTREIKLAVNTSTALASGGWQNVTPAGWGRNGALCRTDYGHLREFIQAVGRGELSEAQIIARAITYANAGWSRYWELEDANQDALGMNQEAVITAHDEKVCPVCSDAEAQGWQMRGTWRLPIHLVCRCHKIYRR